MLNNEDIIEQFKIQFARFEQNLNGQKEHPVHGVRKQALSAIEKIGIPTPKDEEWRFTNLEPLFNKKFHLSLKNSAEQLKTNEVQNFLYRQFNGPQFVFVDGYFAPQLSSKIEDNNHGIVMTNLAQYFNENSEALEMLSDENMMQYNIFTALNTVFGQDGIVIQIPDGVVLQAPINILYLSSSNAQNAAAHVRNVIKVGKNAQARITETYLSLGSTEHFTNTFTLAQIGENGHLIHNKIQNESLKAFHFGNLIVHQQENSQFISNNFAFGGGLARNTILVKLNGQGGNAKLNGFYMGNNTQHIDNNTLIDHTASNCTSRELYQGILNDTATAVFSGKILVRPNAQKTDANQSNNCLLLSDEARIDTKPQLEIYADDVRCTHGTTVGQLDEEAIFYLRSRGISEQRSKNLLIYSFAERIIDQLKVASVREFVDAIILQRFKENMNFTK